MADPYGNFGLDNFNEINWRTLPGTDKSKELQWRALELAQKSYFQDSLEKKVKTMLDKRETILDMTDLMQFLYFTPEQAAYWKELQGETNVAGIVLDLMYLRHLKNRPDFSHVLDLGCGTGDKGAYIAKLLGGKDKNKKLTLFDFSPQMLDAAKRNHGEIAASYKQGDLLESVPRLWGERHSLYLLLGQTIGNFDEPAIVIGNIALAMKEGDYLFVEWFQKKPEDYHNEKSDKFCRLELCGLAGFHSEDLTMLVGDDNPDNQESSWNKVYYKTKKTTIALNGTDYDIPENVNIFPMKSRRFTDLEMLDLFWSSGFELEPVKNDKRDIIKEFEQFKYALFRKRKQDTVSKKHHWVSIAASSVLTALGMYAAPTLWNYVHQEPARITSLEEGGEGDSINDSVVEEKSSIPQQPTRNPHDDRDVGIRTKTDLEDGN